MKRIKLDENFPSSFVEIFRKENIDASSVLEQNISGSEDDDLFNLCTKEGRVLVSFDLDFANIIRYPANDTPGIIVCRVRKQINLQDIRTICIQVIHVIQSQDLDGCLFVVDGHIVRKRKPNED